MLVARNPDVFIRYGRFIGLEGEVSFAVEGKDKLEGLSVES